MRVFVTGAAGFIGRATVRDLVKNGHEVLGLSRSDASAQKITEDGGKPHPGSLEDLESLKSGARAADGVIHLAFIHDFSNMAHSTAVDRTAIEALGDAMAGTGKPLLIASGTLGLSKDGALATEDIEADPDHPFSDRPKADRLLFGITKEKGVRGMIVRFSPTVHGAGDWGFMPMIIAAAREKGVVTYVGDGSPRWNAVHRNDAAALCRLALEKGTAGATYHAVAEYGIPMKDIMAVIGKKLALPVQGRSFEEAKEPLGWMVSLIGMDSPTSSEKTQKELGWSPKELGLLSDLEANYFS